MDGVDQHEEREMMLTLPQLKAALIDDNLFHRLARESGWEKYVEIEAIIKEVHRDCVACLEHKQGISLLSPDELEEMKTRAYSRRALLDEFLDGFPNDS